MQENTTITLPKLGESIVSATVVQWFKKIGDRVERDEALLEVSTDKVNSEIPSPVAGILQAILAEPDVELQVGEPLAIIGSKAVVSNPVSTPTFAATPNATLDEVPINPFPSPCPLKCRGENADSLSPAVLRLLQEKKIPLSEIEKIPHSGEGGRLTKKDVENYTVAPSTPTSQTATLRVKMTPLRKAIADNMVKSFYGAPHATLITEVDVTRLVKIIAEQKTTFQQTHGAKLSVTAFAARAITRALSAYPLLNSSLEGDTILVKRFVNLGIAVSVDQSVMVPVICNAEGLQLEQIAKKIGELAEKARAHTLSPQDVQEGTITLTNFGMTGVSIGVPIIRYPEVAIVGLGAITKKVVALADDSIAIRSMMMVSLTFDHRVLDGLYGCGFLSALKKHLEEDL